MQRILNMSFMDCNCLLGSLKVRELFSPMPFQICVTLKWETTFLQIFSMQRLPLISYHMKYSKSKQTVGGSAAHLLDVV